MKLVGILFLLIATAGSTWASTPSSATVTNTQASVTVDVDSNGYLTETYYTLSSTGDKQTILTYNGPLLTATTFDGVFISWENAKIVNDTSIIVTGTILYQEDSNRSGGDYFSANISENEPSYCMSMCLNDTKCIAWTYVKPGIQNTFAQCWLKNGNFSQVLSSCCESGTVGFLPTLTRLITLNPDLAIFRISHTLETPLDISLISLDDWYNFAPFPVDFAYSPSIKHQDTDLVPHWEFKSPAVMFQTNTSFAAMIPDLDTITADLINSFPPNLDLKNDGETYASFSYAVTQSTLTFHSLYSRQPNAMSWGPTQPITTNYYLILSSEAVPLQGYTLVTEFLWTMFGSSRLQSSPDFQTGYFNKSLLGFDSWRFDTWHRFAQEVYFQFSCGNETCGSMTSYRNQFAEGFGTNQDGWFNSWFQVLRTAYGMYVAGQRDQDDALMIQARQVLNLALHLPAYSNSSTGESGPFPSIFWLGDDGSMNWVMDSGWAGLCRSLPNPPADCMEYYHSFDMSWTAYWLIKWTDLVEDSRIMPLVKGYGDFLLKVQMENGGIPSWFEKDSLRPAPQFQLINSEVAGSALFLAKLYSLTQNEVYLTGAKNAAKYMETFIIPSRQWFDFETFFSCTQKPIGFYDGFTSQYPENNLGKLQACMMYHELYNITADAHYLNMGVRVLDYTLLTQQVFSHPLLSPNLLGGFTTQNTDCEWSDARQGYASSILLDYYRITWDLEYLERGVAALRSSFAVAPYENWAHTGGSQGDSQGALTGIHWCQGSGMTSIELTYDWLRDAYINVKMNHGVGVNGCSIGDLEIGSNTISFTITTTFTWDSLMVVLEGVAGTYDVTVNGNSLGNFGPAGSNGLVYVDVPGKILSL